MSEKDLFAELMGQVQPLNKSENRVQPKKVKHKHEILRGLEDREATHHHVIKQQSLAPKRTETWLLRADGVSSKDIKSLGQMNIKHELDLHGCTQAQAEKALHNFFNQSLDQYIRHLCIVHGKGNHSQGKSVLKDLTYQWLEHSAYAHYILVATPALQSKGGACNILLRKNTR